MTDDSRQCALNDGQAEGALSSPLRYPSSRAPRAAARDMTTGAPWRHLLAFAWPLLLGNLIQSAYFMVDALLVGRLLGPQALAAVGGVNSVIFVVLGFVFGLSMGVGVLTAQRFGAHDPRGVRQSVGTGVWVCLVVTAVVTALCLLFTDPILRLIQTPSAIFEPARTYLRIAFAGTWMMVFFNFQSATLRAFGDSRTPLWCLAGSSLLNIALDIPFIRLWGVAGASWATNLATLFSALACFALVTCRLDALRLRRSDWRPRWPVARFHLRVGLPMGLQFSITGLGAMVLQGAINTFGVAQIAGMTAARQVENLAAQLPITLGQTVATYAAQNTGAAKPERIRAGVRFCLLLILLSGAVFTALALLFGRHFIGCFLHTQSAADTELSTAALDVGCRLLSITAPFLVPLGAIFIYRNALQGMGRAFWPMMAGAAEMAMRVLVALVLLPWWGVHAVYWGDPLAWIGACAVLLPAYLCALAQLGAKPLPLGPALAFLRAHAVTVISALAAALSFAFAPRSAWWHAIDWRTLNLLFCLMFVVAGLRACNLFRVLAQRLLAGRTQLRTLLHCLVQLTFLLAMLVTNDVALVALVPFAILLFDRLGLRRLLPRVIILQTLAANLGSMATPIGNPQNLFLYTTFNLSPRDFFPLMLTLTFIGWLALLGLTCTVRNEPLALPPEADPERLTHPRKVALYCALFALCLLAVFRLLPGAWLFAIVLTCALLFSRRILRQVDYGLLLTFLCFFVFSHNMGLIPAVSRALSSLDPIPASFLSSQIISNVPAAILLAPIAKGDWAALLLGCNLGGFGTPVASLASLIAFNFYLREPDARPGHYLGIFTVCNLAVLFTYLAAALLSPI
ncbi:MAG: MATE family efflux transporter [Candidatus Spyradenecus sp.]